MENEKTLIELTEDEIIVENNVLSSKTPSPTQGEINGGSEDTYDSESYENDG